MTGRWSASELSVMSGRFALLDLGVLIHLASVNGLQDSRDVDLGSYGRTDGTSAGPFHRKTSP